jgi:hypothetical protein
MATPRPRILRAGAREMNHQTAMRIPPDGRRRQSAICWGQVLFMVGAGLTYAWLFFGMHWDVPLVAGTVGLAAYHAGALVSICGLLSVVGHLLLS